MTVGGRSIWKGKMCARLSFALGKDKWHLSHPSSLIAPRHRVGSLNFTLRGLLICARQRALDCFDELNGISNTVHLHYHLDVGVLDAVRSDKIRHAKADAADSLRLFVLTSHRAINPFTANTSDDLRQVVRFDNRGRPILLVPVVLAELFVEPTATRSDCGTIKQTLP